jgi:hypothetical protein
MASLAQLQADVASYLNRQDILTNGVMPGWVLTVETIMAQTLRSRFQETSAIQPIDAAYIALPSDFATMASIRDNTTGELLQLRDEWSGHWSSQYQPIGSQPYDAITALSGPSVAYRLVANCIEFLPHPQIPNPPDPSWVPQQVQMAYYRKPRPLLLPTDTNVILENLYSIYLYGVVREGAIWAIDDDRAAQMDARWQQAVTEANLHKQQSDYSGAPLRAEVAVCF